MIDPQLQFVLEHTRTPEEARYLLSYILDENTLIQLKSGIDVLITYVHKNKHLVETTEDVRYLKKIVFGKANMESTFERLSPPPTLKQVRLVFAQRALALFSQRFPELPIEELFLTDLMLFAYVQYPRFADPEFAIPSLIERSKGPLGSIFVFAEWINFLNKRIEPYMKDIDKLTQSLRLKGMNELALQLTQIKESR